MASKTVYYIAIFIGSSIGGFIPTLWGADFLSLSSLFFSALGGSVGFIIVYKYL